MYVYIIYIYVERERQPKDEKDMYIYIIIVCKYIFKNLNLVKQIFHIIFYAHTKNKKTYRVSNISVLLNIEA